MIIKKKIKIGVILILLILVTAFLFFTGGGKKSDSRSPDVTADKEVHEGESTSAQQKRKIKYWQAPMDPTYISDKPGKSPMGMDLIPIYEDEEDEADIGTIKIDPVTVQNIGIRTTKAARGTLHATIRTVGHVTYDEELLEQVHTKISGWIERLFVETTGEYVRKNQKLFSVYSPELVSTQEEYLQALKYKRETAGSKFTDVAGGGETLFEAARRRLLLMDIDTEQIEKLEQLGEVQKDMLLRSPAAGIVVKKHVFDGMKVTPGMELYTIADLSKVWVLASIYEYELPFLKIGQKAEMSLAYEPGAVYKGHISFIYPYLSAKTRTVQVRMEFDNPDLKLKPDMYADVVIKTKVSDDAILIPNEAVIRTGTRNVVITALGKGKFLPKDVTIGPEGEGFIQILSGLDEGETVVSSGQFLIDSESNLREAINKMLEANKASQSSKEEKASEPPAGHKIDEAQTEEKIQMIHIDMNKDQKNMVSQLLGGYMRMHSALVSESVSKVAEEARVMVDIIGKMKESDTERRLKEIIDPVEMSLDGLLSEDIEKVRNSFALLGKTMGGYVIGTGKEEARSAGIKVYFCPMNKKYWIQKESDVQNPYLGKDMLICGNEVAY